MARHQAAEREKSVSVLASLLPFLSVLYSEFIFAYFAHMPITPVKVWMALGLGGIALALSRTTPLKGLNFLLLTVWTVGLWGFTFVQFLYRQMFGVCMGLKAGIKGLEFLAGLVQIIRHKPELAFFAFDDCGAGAAFYTDAQPFKETRECTGQAYGCKLDGPARRVAAFCNPDFRGRCTRSARHGGRALRPAASNDAL